jgi:hypothetical protein
MKRPTFLQGVVVAAILGFLASAFVAALIPFVGVGAIARLVIPGLALAYLLYLFSCNNERTGRVTTLVLWAAMSVMTWWFAPPLPLYLLVHIAAIWLVRSLYFYSGVFPALMDMGLNALSLVIALWAISRTGSVFLATWCFFLVTALFVVIPQSVRGKSRSQSASNVDNEKFERARRQADQALRQLFTQ